MFCPSLYRWSIGNGCTVTRGVARAALPITWLLPASFSTPAAATSSPGCDDQRSGPADCRQPVVLNGRHIEPRRPLANWSRISFAPRNQRPLRWVATIAISALIIIFLPCDFYLLSFFFFSPNLSGRRLDVYHTWLCDVRVSRRNEAIDVRVSRARSASGRP